MAARPARDTRTPRPAGKPAHVTPVRAVAHATRRAASLPADLDRLIHDRIRLGIVSALAAQPTLSFTDLRAALGTTDGNLSVHARKLEDAGYLSCAKRFDGRTPRTEYGLTAAGRRALEKYLDHMDAVIRAARRATS